MPGPLRPARASRPRLQPPGDGEAPYAETASLAGAHNAALDRALEAALRPAGPDRAGAEAWSDVHDRAVAGLSGQGAPGARPPPTAARGAAASALVPERGGPDWGR